MPQTQKTHFRGVGGKFSAMPNRIAENKDPEDDNNFVICTDEDHMSGGYNRDSEWEDLPPAATYSERFTKLLGRQHKRKRRSEI